ncbi:hypothetical protein HC749_20395 [Arthrobacter sp. S13_S34]|nr:hypothetical protein [Arthrobacter sp. S13_S34]
MENPDTLILNLTFLGTVGVAFLMFLVLFLLGAITLVLAGLGRLAAAVLMALFGRRSRKESLPLVRFTGPAGSQQQASDGGAGAESAAGPARPGLLARAFRKRPGKTPRDWRAALQPAHMKTTLRTAVEHHPALTAARREPPVLAEDWATAVADADARARAAKARAASPDIKVSVRDLPDPQVPAEEVAEVAPLVESALDNSRPSRELPRSFKKPQVPHVLAPLDTGSLVSLSGPAQISRAAAEAAREAGSKGSASKGRQPLP